MNSREERLGVFAESMEIPNPLWLRQMEQEALAERVPVIRPRTQGLIKFFLALQRPMRILEIGTGTGFSALLMDAFSPEGARIVTIEKDPVRAGAARDHFAARGAGERITLLEGDAADILPALEGPFDLVFMDAAKGQYIRFLPEALRLLTEGGLLISDNILREEEILSSRYAVRRRDRTIHKRMRAYLRELTGRADLQTLLLEAGDGTAVTVKKKR